MPNAAGDVPAFPQRDATREIVTFRMFVPIGATGAVGTVVKNNPGLCITRANTGDYDVVHPPCVRAWYELRLLTADASPTVDTAQVDVTSIAPTAGTFSFYTCLSGTAANPESGSAIEIIIECETQPNSGTV